jgi:hypothetical protein
MKTYRVTITQIETLTYRVRAESEDAAVEQAQEWNEEQSGDTPSGAIDYDYTFDSETTTEVVA